MPLVRQVKAKVAGPKPPPLEQMVRNILRISSHFEPSPEIFLQKNKGGGNGWSTIFNSAISLESHCLFIHFIGVAEPFFLKNKNF